MALEFFNYRRVSALVISIIIIGIAFAVFMFKLANVSVNTDYEVVKSNNVKNEVDIYTNFYGIPYIYAANEDDLFFAVGYYHASNRLWQMDYYRRLSSGRLSEIFGNQTIKVDKFMRCFDIEEICKRNYDSISGKSKNILDSYARGVNYFIEKNSARLPMEFNALNYKPVSWKPYHSLMVNKFLTFELSLSIWSDITFGEILEKLGTEQLNYFSPNDDYTNTIYESPKSPVGPNKLNYAYFSKEIHRIGKSIGVVGSSSGSNCWSFRNSDSINGATSILANDAHLMLGIPSRWIQMKIKCDDIDAIGLTMPGVPLVLSGRNKDVAWGITNIMLDGFDYFVEKLDSKEENYYISDSTLSKLTYIVDTIKVKDALPEVYYKRKTASSYLVSDFQILSDPKLFLNIQKSDNKKSLQENNTLSFKWVGSSLGDEIFSIYKINTSRNFNDFRDALRHWSSPGLNFHYADISGNMGVISAGTIPIRNQLCNPNLPNPGWKKEYNWSGTKRLNDTTFSKYSSINKFYASANNKLSNSENIFISNYWEPDSRINRITELLNESDKFYYRDAQYLQNDFLSVYARDLISISLPILESYKNLLSQDEIEVLNLMKKWDFIISRASVEASVYTFFYEKLVYNTFYDELGERLYKQYSFISSLPARKLMSLIRSSDSPLFDVRGTKNVENKEFIIFKSFRDAVQEFNTYFENTPLNKRYYGKMHNLTLEHPLSKSDFLNPAVTLGPFETGGNNTTINNGEWNINNPYKQVIGASMRVISDLSINYVYTSIPGGASGDPMHPNYSDQLQIWLNGGYVKLPLDAKSEPDEFKIFIKFKPE